MKHYNDPLDKQLKQLGNKVQLSNDDKQDVLMSINEKMDEEHAQSGGFFNKTFAIAFSGIAVILFLLIVPQLIMQGPGHDGNHGAKAILPDNIGEVEQPPFEIKLPSYLPFEVRESSIDYDTNDLPNNVMVKYASVDGHYFTVRIENGGVIDSDQKEIITEDSQTYYYSEFTVKIDRNPKVQELTFKEGDIKYTLINNSDVGDIDHVEELPVYSKEELIKIAESLKTVKWPEQNDKAILPNNLSEVEKPPYEFKLPSQLPFEVNESYAEFSSEHKVIFVVRYFAKNNDSINIEIHGNVREVFLDFNETINGVSYSYSESEQSRILSFQDDDNFYNLKVRANPDTNEVNISKQELVEVAESLVSFNWPEQKQDQNENKHLQKIKNELDISMGGEVMELFGDDYVEIYNRDFRQLIRFDLGAEENYSFEKTQNVDTEGLKNGNLDVQLFVEFAEGTIKSYKAFYLDNDNQLHFYFNDFGEIYEYPIDENLYGEQRDNFYLEKLRNDLNVSMTKEEVLQTIGPYDFDFHSYEAGKDIWRYDIQLNHQSDNFPPYNFVDFPAIVNDQLRMQVFIRWKSSRSVESFSAVYYNEHDDKVHHYQSNMSESTRLAEAYFPTDGTGKPQLIEIGNYIYDVPSVQHLMNQYDESYDQRQFLSIHELYMHQARIGKGTDYVGIDYLKWWYQRNLIIYSNVVNLTELEDDRILLLIGLGHVYLAQQFLNESNLFEVEDVLT